MSDVSTYTVVMVRGFVADIFRYDKKKCIPPYSGMMNGLM